MVKKRKKQRDFIKELKAPIGTEGLNLKRGVKIPDGGNDLTRSLQNIPTPLRKLREKVVVTEGMDTINRKNNSLHKKNRALDIRNKNLDSVEQGLVLNQLRSGGNVSAGVHGENTAQEHIHASILNQKLVGARQLATDSATQKEVAEIARKNLPTHEADKVTAELSSGDKVVRSVQVATEQKQQGAEPSLKNAFLESLSFFIPQIGGALVGGLIDGTEGAVAGYEEAGKLGKSFRDYQLDKAKVEAKNQPSSLELAKFNIQAKNLEARQDELKIRKNQTQNLEEDRSIRREERDITRSIKAKNTFNSRADIKADKEKMKLLADMDDILTGAPKLAPGIIPFKIAKGIGGEVGNLTKEEREAAGISVDFYSKVRRNTKAFFNSELPEEDTKMLKQYVKAIRSKQIARMRAKATSFADSRSKDFSADVKSRFREDLLAEHGLTEKKGKSLMTDAQRARREELRKKYNR